MARGTKSAVSAYERQKWLADLDQGKGITQIAQTVGRDIRIVKRHIEVARQERETSRARHDFLLGRLEQHQDDLLNEVRRLRQIIAQFPPRPLESDEPLGKKVHEAFEEHIKRLRLHRLLESYRNAVLKYDDAKRDAIDHLTSTESKLVASLPSNVETYPWASRLVSVLEREGAPERSYLENKYEGGHRCAPSWSDIVLTSSPIAVTNLVAVVEAHKQLVSEAEPLMANLHDHIRHVEQLVEATVDELDSLLVRRLAPGQCKYCPI